MRKVFNFILILMIGGLGGILASQFLLPSLANTWPFDKISWFKQIKDGTTIINQTEKVIIAENTALEETISKVSSSVVGIKSISRIPKSKKVSQETVAQGTGFIIASDGLIITASSSISGTNDQYFVFKDNKNFPAEIFKKDLNSGLVLLKIKETNLPVVSLAIFENLRLGERVVLLGVDATSSPLTRFVNLAIIKTLTEKDFSINIDKELEKANGAPLVNIKGEIVGLIKIEKNNQLEIITVDQIKNFLSF